MIDPTDLIGLLRGYAEGDVLARKALLDVLGEEDDPRAEEVRREGVDWDRVAGELVREGRNQGGWDFPYYVEHSRVRWWIDCVRFGSTAPVLVTQAVREERQRWLRDLFPECNEMWG